MSMLEVLFVGVSDVERILVENYLDIPIHATVANNTSQARNHLQHKASCVAIFDAEVPGLDVRKLLSDGKFHQYIILSSRDSDIERRKSLLKSRERYLTRPYSEKQFCHAFHAALH